MQEICGKACSIMLSCHQSATKKAFQDTRFVVYSGRLFCHVFFYVNNRFGRDIDADYALNCRKHIDFMREL